jgi:uncharacterized protein
MNMTARSITRASARIVLALAALAGGRGVALALANPASVYCAQRGGHVDTETVANGAQKGICVLPSGTRIDEWVLFRNTHRTTH